jgi:hypothetical protein
MARISGWHCCQYDIDPEDHPNCERRLAQGCAGCEYAIWQITSRIAAEADQPQEGELIH